MVNYGNGKIYKVEPVCEHVEGEIYIGSTTERYLSRRMDKHRSGYKLWQNNGTGGHVRSYDLFDKYGIENCRIILLETVHANSKDELESRESHYIQTLKCVNKQIPLRVKILGKNAYDKLYKSENIEHIQNYQKVYNKIYQSKNKEYLKDYWKKYEENNKEYLTDYRKQYREKSKNKIEVKITCTFCNCKVVKRHWNTHECSSFCNAEYEYQWDDGSPCSEQDYIDTMVVGSSL